MKEDKEVQQLMEPQCREEPEISYPAASA
jgi:hypothetical protein